MFCSYGCQAVKKADPMPFFQDAKRKPPVASRPKKPNGYGSNEDLINNVVSRLVNYLGAYFFAVCDLWLL